MKPGPRRPRTEARDKRRMGCPLLTSRGETYDQEDQAELRSPIVPHHHGEQKRGQWPQALSSSLWVSTWLAVQTETVTLGPATPLPTGPGLLCNLLWHLQFGGCPTQTPLSRNIHEGGPLLSYQLRKQKPSQPHSVLTRGQNFPFQAPPYPPDPPNKPRPPP